MSSTAIVLPLVITVPEIVLCIGNGAQPSNGDNLRLLEVVTGYIVPPVDRLI